MGQGIEVGGTAGIANPKALLAGGLKAGIVALTFGAQSVSPLKMKTFSVNRKTIVGGNGFVFGAAPVLFAVIPVFVVTRTAVGFGMTERAAEFLADSSLVKGFPVLVHGQPGGANQTAGGQLVGVLGIALIQRNNGLALIDVLHQIVDRFCIVALVTKECTLPEGQNSVSSGEYLLHDGGIRRVSWGSQFIERQTGNAVHQHMVFVTPVKLILSFVVLVGCRVNAQGAVRVSFGVVLRVEFVFAKGLRIVLFCVGCNRRRVQADERGVHNAKPVQFLYLFGHDFLQFPVVQLFEETVIGPIRWQWFRNVEPAVMSNEAVVIQIVRQIRDLGKTLTFHHNERTDH